MPQEIVYSFLWEAITFFRVFYKNNSHSIQASSLAWTFENGARKTPPHPPLTQEGDSQSFLLRIGFDQQTGMRQEKALRQLSLPLKAQSHRIDFLAKNQNEFIFYQQQPVTSNG